MIKGANNKNNNKEGSTKEETETLANEPTEIKEEQTSRGIKVKNIDIKSGENESTLTAVLINTTEETIREIESTILLLDEEKKEIAKVVATIIEIEAGNETTIESIISTDCSNVRYYIMDVGNTKIEDEIMPS